MTHPHTRRSVEMPDFRPPPPGIPLSPTQVIVAKALATGRSVKRISAVTGIDEANVRYHIGRIAQLLGPPNEDEMELSERDRVFAWAYWTYKDEHKAA